METETLSNYEQNREKHLDNSMDSDIVNNEEESVSPVNKTYEDRTESTELDSRRIDIESDEDCEEEEEKLLLSPAQSDKAYDSDDAGDPSSPVLNRDLLDSDNEAEAVESAQQIETNDEKSKEESEEEKIVEEKKEESKTNTENQNVSANRDSTEVKESEKTEESCGNTDVAEENETSDEKRKDFSNKDKDEDILRSEEESQDLKNSEDNPLKPEETKDSEGEGRQTVKSSHKKGNTASGSDENKGSDDVVITEDENKGSEVPNKENGDADAEKVESKDKSGKSDTEESSLLKATLSKPLQEDSAKEAEMDEEMDMDEDFDPSLLCPELSMEVDEAPVITSDDAPAPVSDGNKSPLRLYDPIFSTFVDEMTGAEVDFNLTAEELELKAKTYGRKNPIQFTKIHCTACNIHLGSALDGQGNRFVHPLLKVLICKKCYHFYTSGEFEKDEDGSELYCRWCGQGGQVLCCSNCEMVFCKKCIRINFDRKKLMDIQKSDDWLCFRCNPSQLIHLRIHCAEFMEYVQIEIRRAGSSGNVDAFMNTDYCHCCLPQKKKAVEPSASEMKPKKRRRVGEEDPDYNPALDKEDAVSTVVPSTSQQTLSKTPAVAARIEPGSVHPRPAAVRPGSSLGQTFRPRVQVVASTGARPQNYVRLLSGSGVRMASPTQASTPPRPPALRPIRPNVATKHDWFEKTVRAAARVNSNLSYTLTQLNRAQANATSVEALAVVHNKLQEILSSSINSLIQIRKNLRTEFIAGIKNIRFPPKAQTTPPPLTTMSKDDDDVIFIPSDSTSTPPPLVPVKNNTPVSKINLPSSLTLVKKSSPAANPIITITPSKNNPGGSSVVAKKSTSTSADASSRPKGFLRVKSFSALQNVPSECITIPDDPPEEESNEVEVVKEKDPLDVSEENDVNSNGMTNGGDDANEFPITINTLNDGGFLKKLKPAQIVLQRSNEIDELVKTKFGVVNGSNSDDGIE